MTYVEFVTKIRSRVGKDRIDFSQRGGNYRAILKDGTVIYGNSIARRVTVYMWGLRTHMSTVDLSAA